MNMDALLEQLVEHEGLRLKPYRCTAGKLTIGCGRNLDDRGISKDEALYLLRNDIKKCINDAEAVIGSQVWEGLSEARKRVLVDMRFNLGAGGIRTFKNTLQAIREGRYDDASRGMLNSKWARQVGRRAKTLARMMLGG